MSFAGQRDPHVIKAMAPADLVEEYRAFVGSIVNDLHRQLQIRVSMEDLEAYAFEGLLEAQSRFDPDDGTYFVSYAYYRIRGSVLDGCRREGWLSRGELGRRFRGIDEVLETNAAIERDAPRPTSLSEAVERVAEVVDTVATVFLLCSSDVERLAPVAPSQDELIERQSREKLVQSALAVLTDQEREVIQRFHFDDEPMDDIAKLFKRSRSWVSRINTRALDKMRTHLLSLE